MHRSTIFPWNALLLPVVLATAVNAISVSGGWVNGRYRQDKRAGTGCSSVSVVCGFVLNKQAILPSKSSSLPVFPVKTTRIID